MRSTKALKILVILFAIVLIMAMLMPTAFAASNLQSNPTTGSSLQKKPASTWIGLIRYMEQGYSDAGELEELNSNLTSVTSNNIDVHMMKTTEYGAMAILSASEYGKGNKVATTTRGDNSGSTTGNKTGVIIDTTLWEWVAGRPYSGFSSDIGGAVEGRYYSEYTRDEASHRVGDALVECKYWHGAQGANWKGDGNSRHGFLRGGGGIFAFSTDGYNYSDHNYITRGVAVCGEGF